MSTKKTIKRSSKKSTKSRRSKTAEKETSRPRRGSPKTARSKRGSPKAANQTTRSARKTAKKTTARKKASRSKRGSPEAAGKKVLVCVGDERCFWTSDGQVLGSLTDLRDALEGMREEIYKHHVGNGKNDFADWVEYVLHDRALAGALRHSRKPSTARAFVVQRLNVYNL